MNDRIVGRLTTLKGTKNPFEIHLYDWGLFAVATQISIFEGTGFSCSWCEEGWEDTNYLQCGWKLSLPLHLWTYSISFPSTAIYSAGKGGLRNLKRGDWVEGHWGVGESNSNSRPPSLTPSLPSSSPQSWSLSPLSCMSRYTHHDSHHTDDQEWRQKPWSPGRTIPTNRTL